MKRITSACLEQTIRFDTNNEANPKEDFQKFLSSLDKRRTKYELVSSEEAQDGSIIVKIKKRYNNYSTEGYL
jgi:ATP-dependent RNA circularization protein (DNA/RNA ligase family)